MNRKNCKNSLAALLLTVAAGAAGAMGFQTAVTPTADADGNLSAPFAATHLQAGAFTDTFSFGSFATPVDVNASLVTFATSAAQNIDFVSASLNGVAFQFSRSTVAGFADARELGKLVTTRLDAGVPLVLTVTGHAAALLPSGFNPGASYTGTLNLVPSVVAQVPEPGTYALWLAGLAAVGVVARRRAVR
jgi:hypothetical protein